jgi:hypothetical protein
VAEVEPGVPAVPGRTADHNESITIDTNDGRHAEAPARQAGQQLALQPVQGIGFGRGEVLRCDRHREAVPIEPDLGQLELVDDGIGVQQRLGGVRRGELERGRLRRQAGERAGPAGEHHRAEAGRVRPRRHVVDAQHGRRALVLLRVGQRAGHLASRRGEHQDMAGAVGGVVDAERTAARGEVKMAREAAGGECTGDLGRAGGGHGRTSTPSVCNRG